MADRSEMSAVYAAGLVGQGLDVIRLGPASAVRRTPERHQS